MKKDIPISLWDQFYRLANELAALAPWDWMLDVDLFGVVDPDTGEVNYCGILGAGGRPKGLAMLRGSKGLFSFERMLDQEPEYFQLLESYQLDGVILTFQNLSSLSSLELNLLTSTGFYPEGMLEAPILKDHTPGFVPWKIDDPALLQRFLVTLDQGLQLAKNFRQDPDLLDYTGAHEKRILVRIPERDASETLIWKNDWMPEPSYLSEIEAPEINRIFLRSNCSDLPRLPEEWTTDLFYFPQPIHTDEERPHLPQMAILAIKEKGAIIGRAKFQQGEVAQGIEQLFLDTAKRAGGLPKKLIATRPESFAIWQPLANSLSIDIQLRTDELLMEEIKIRLINSMLG
ncbi:MAG: hypothetical protein NWR72_21165 [Bacteroidia bacterium]|nr:hypothetical protein [Bacteroidia bacterium]